MSLRDSLKHVSSRPRYLGRIPAEIMDPLDVQVGPRGDRLLYRSNARPPRWPAEMEHFRLVLGKRILLEFDARYVPRFSPCGTRLSWVEVDKEGKERCVVDGQAGEQFDKIGTMLFTDDDTHFVYSAYRGRESFIVVDGSVLAPPARMVSRLFMSRDGTRFGYMAKIGSACHAVIDRSIGPPFAGGISKISFSDDGKRAAYCGFIHKRTSSLPWEEGERMVLVDGEVFGPYEASTQPVLSDDGATWACGVWRGTRSFLLQDGKETPCEGGIESIMFLPERNLFTKIALHQVRPDGPSEGRVCVILSGPRRGERLPCDRVEKFSRDGSSSYYVDARPGEEWVVHDGVPGPAFANVDMMTFSPDGRLLAYAARIDKDVPYHLEWRGPQVVVAGDWRSEAFDDVVYPVEAIDRTTVAFAVRRGREIWWEVRRID